MAAMNEKDILNLMDVVYDAYSDGDWDTIKKNVADNATLVAMPLNKTFKGPSGVVDYMRAHKTAFDLTLSIKRRVACADLAIVEYSARGTHNAPYQLPSGDSIPATGRNVELNVCHVGQCKDNKIVDIHTYFDMGTLLSQIGVGLTEDVHRH